MKKASLLFLSFILILIRVNVYGQSNAHRQHLAIGFAIPIGSFAESHLAGLVARYTYSKSRFGQLESFPKKRTGFAWGGGVSYFLGKKITTAGYSSKFGGYSNIFASGGVIINPSKKSNLLLMAGPVGELYKGFFNVGWGGELSASYYFTKQTAIKPGISYVQFPGTMALWSGMITIARNFK